MTLKLETTDTQLQGLWTVYHAKRRRNTTIVAVDPEALGNLLKDHHTLFGAATGPVVRLDGRAGGKDHTVDIGHDQESMR